MDLTAGTQDAPGQRAKMPGAMGLTLRYASMEAFVVKESIGGVEITSSLAKPEPVQTRAQ